MVQVTVTVSLLLQVVGLQGWLLFKLPMYQCM
jgi:hypothetical protein